MKEPKLGTKKHLEWRKKERQEGRMNAPMSRRVKIHSFSCRCAVCWPAECQKAYEEFAHIGEQKWTAEGPNGIESAKSMVPRGDKAKKGFKQPTKKWTPRCSTCEGRGEITSLKGPMVPCPRCKE